MKWFDDEIGNTFVAIVIAILTITMIWMDYDHEQRIIALEESCHGMHYKTDALWDLEISRLEQYGMD